MRGYFITYVNRWRAICGVLYVILGRANWWRIGPDGDRLAISDDNPLNTYASTSHRREVTYLN